MIAEILQQTWRVMAVVHQDLDSAVIVEVRGGHAVTVKSRTDSGAGVERDIFEPAVSLIPVEHFPFSEGCPHTLSIYLRIDVAVSDEKVGPAVIIDIEKKRPPTQKLRVCTESRLVRYVRECAIPVVVIERGVVV